MTHASVERQAPERRGSRKLALAGGVLYLMAFIFSIPAVFLYGPVLTDPAYILGVGADSQVLLGAVSTSSRPWRASASRLRSTR